MSTQESRERSELQSYLTGICLLLASAHPCELYCRPIDEQFSEKMLDAVIDGTPCFEGGSSRNVCINGICKVLGMFPSSTTLQNGGF